MTLTPRRVRPSLGPVAVSLAVGAAVLLVGALVNGCQINKLLGGSTTSGTLLVTPGEVRDSALAGANSPRRSTLLVANSGTWSATEDSPWIGVNPGSGSGPLVWTASKSSSWLTLGTVAGVGNGKIAWTMSSAGLGIGTYRDTIVVVAVGAAGSPAKIPVTLRRRRND